LSATDRRAHAVKVDIDAVCPEKDRGFKEEHRLGVAEEVLSVRVVGNRASLGSFSGIAMRELGPEDSFDDDDQSSTGVPSSGEFSMEEDRLEEDLAGSGDEALAGRLCTQDPEWRLKEVWQRAEAAQADVLLVTDLHTHAELGFFSQRCPGHSLALFRVEASDSARCQRGWIPDVAKDALHSDADLDRFAGWTACFDNSFDGGAGLAEEWVERTALPRILAK